MFAANQQFASRLRRWVFVITISGVSIFSLCFPSCGILHAEPGDPDAVSNEANRSWPTVRGPHFDGHSSETDLVDSWTESGPPVLWTRELGQGYSAFVGWNNRVATQAQTYAGQFVFCLDADTGRTIWRYRYDWQHDPSGRYPGPRATPTYSDGRIYFAAPSGLIGCLAADDGSLIWSINVNEKFGGRGAEFGFAASPVVVGGKVIVPVGGEGASIVALNADDGRVAWAAGDDQASYTPVYPIKFREQHLVVGYLQNSLVCRELDTGEEIWRWELETGYDEHSVWPIYREPYLWIASPFKKGSQLFELSDDEQQPIRSTWESGVMSNDIFSSVLYEGAIYGFDIIEAQAKVYRPSRGQFRCIDFTTGEERWSIGDRNPRRTVEPSPDDIGQRVGQANVIVADGKLILFNEIGELILARATPKRYEELARVSILGGELCWTAPALHRGRLYVRNHSRAACVYLGPPESLEQQISAASLSVADIPQTKHVDLSAVILGVENEKAFDVPTTDELTNWFVASLGGMIVLNAFWMVLVRKLGGSRITPTVIRRGFLVTVFLLGVLGTTILGRWLGEFTFTWPLSIFIAFHAAVYQIRFVRSHDSTSNGKWKGRLVVCHCRVY